MSEQAILPKYEGINHDPKIVEAWGNDYLWLQTKMDINGRVKEKDFINHFGSPISLDHNIESKLGSRDVLFFPISLTYLKFD